MAKPTHHWPWSFFCVAPTWDRFLALCTLGAPLAAPSVPLPMTYLS
ncbi:hypothetical protein ACW73L_19795 [Methylolobus aquaticus]